MGERARHCFDRFNAQQVAVVIEYLTWKLDSLGYDDPTIIQALKNYWRQRALQGVIRNMRLSPLTWSRVHSTCA